MPAFTVGLLSLLFSRFFHVPSQIFSLPGIFALVPGMLALSSFYGHGNNSGMEIGTRVAVVASSIVFGLFTARIPFVALRKPTEVRTDFL